MNKHINYRPDLDGLRAIAVISVLIYHAKITLYGTAILKGGFFGVDIFFVLSGYLISSIIIKSEKEGSFSFMAFYKSRVKRIIPALLTVLVFSSFLAYKFLLPDSLVAYGKSLVFASLFLSNFYFFGEDSYISEASELKPLLHTWSLSLEWQFYLIFPVLMYLILKSKLRYQVIFTITALVVSFVLAVYQSSFHPNMSFYLLPARAWELLAGTLTALYARRDLTGRLFKKSGFIGLVLIVFSLCFINDTVQHPSFVTIIPVIGTCLIISSKNNESVSFSILSNRYMVYVGLVSYSLYLWHQPLFAFYRINYGKIDVYSAVVLIFISFAIAVLTYYFIERPFRVRRYNKMKVAILSLLGFFAASFSSYSYVTDGDVNRLSPLAKDAYQNYNSLEFRRLRGNPGIELKTGNTVTSCSLRDPYQPCKFGNESWITIGDSYAAMFDYYLSKELVSKGLGLISLSYEQCPFVSGVWFANAAECSEVNKRRWKVISNLKGKKTFVVVTNFYFFSRAKKEILHSLYGSKSVGTVREKVPDSLVWQSFADNINRLVKLGHKVIVVYPIPGVSGDPKREFFKLIKSNASEISEVIYDNDSRGMLDAEKYSLRLDKLLVDDKNLIRVKPQEVMCDGKGCIVINKNGSLYNGGSHLSHSGVKMISDELLKKYF